MGTSGPIKPNHKAIMAYYQALKSYARQDVGHESALRSAFQNLLDETGRRLGWTVIPELCKTAEGCGLIRGVHPGEAPCFLTHAPKAEDMYWGRRMHYSGPT